MTINDAVIANRQRKLESGLITQEEFDRASRPRGPEYVAPMVGYLCTDLAQDVNGHVFHVERGRIHNYYFGEEMKALDMGGDGLFSMDELIQDIPATIMSEAPRVAPPYEKAGQRAVLGASTFADETLSRFGTPRPHAPKPYRHPDHDEGSYIREWTNSNA